MHAPKNNEYSSPTTPPMTDAFREPGYGPIAAPVQMQALETYVAFDAGALAETPFALDAWVDQQQHTVAQGL